MSVVIGWREIQFSTDLLDKPSTFEFSSLHDDGRSSFQIEFVLVRLDKRENVLSRHKWPCHISVLTELRIFPI